MERQKHLAGANATYPNIFPHEKGQKVGSNSEGKDLDVSEQTNTYTGTTKGTSITAKQTWYGLPWTRDYIPDIYLSLLRDAKTSYWATLAHHWIASRGVDFQGDTVIFGIFAVNMAVPECSVVYAR